MTDNDRLRSHVLELHTLMSIIWRSAAQEMERWIADNNIELTRIQLGILRLLHHEGDHTLSEISRVFALDPSTLVPVVDGLEDRGLVQRTRDPEDRRRMPITLTDAGRGLAGALPTVDKDHTLMKALSQFDEAEVEQLLSTLCRIAHAMPGASDHLHTSKRRLIAHGAQEEHLVCKQLPQDAAH